MNELKNSFIDLGEAAIPMIDKFIGIVNKVTDVIKDMDEETLNSIVNMTAMGIAVGVSGKAIGGTVSTVGTLSKDYRLLLDGRVNLAAQPQQLERLLVQRQEPQGWERWCQA